MADDSNRVEEENASLRQQIEEVQQKRREGFAQAEELSRAATLKEENDRLKTVLADQKKVLEREQEIRGEIGKDADVTTGEGGLAPETPYTYTPEGPLVSDELDQDVDRDGVLDLNEEN